MREREIVTNTYQDISIEVLSAGMRVHTYVRKPKIFMNGIDIYSVKSVRIEKECVRMATR